jgi:DNA polymerase-3 subunit gamma/tau
VPPTTPATAPSTGPSPAKRPAKRAVDPESMAAARGAIQDTRPAGESRQRGSDVSDVDAHRDDPDADDHSLGGAELLERELGASIIEEIKHD